MTLRLLLLAKRQNKAFVSSGFIYRQIYSNTREIKTIKHKKHVLQKIKISKKDHVIWCLRVSKQHASANCKSKKTWPSRTNLSHKKNRNTHTGNSRCPGAHIRPGSDMEGYIQVSGSNTPCIQWDRHTDFPCSTALH